MAFRDLSTAANQDAQIVTVDIHHDRASWPSSSGSPVAPLRRAPGPFIFSNNSATVWRETKRRLSSRTLKSASVGSVPPAAGDCSMAWAFSRFIRLRRPQVPAWGSLTTSGEHAPARPAQCPTNHGCRSSQTLPIHPASLVQPKFGQALCDSTFINIWGDFFKGGMFVHFFFLTASA